MQGITKCLLRMINVFMQYRCIGCLCNSDKYILEKMKLLNFVFFVANTQK